jgi:hypothetical protein
LFWNPLEHDARYPDSCAVRVFLRDPAGFCW